MGRTNPTFRNVLQQYRSDWGTYRRGLRAEHVEAFDALFDDAEVHADAAGYMNARDPMHSILVSMLLAQKRQVRDLEDRVDALETALAEDEEDAEDRDETGDATGVSTRTAADAFAGRCSSRAGPTGDDAL